MEEPLMVWDILAGSSQLKQEYLSKDMATAQVNHTKWNPYKPNHMEVSQISCSYYIIEYTIT
eukprot:5431202-Ditylum_brightwellii.AAC.1